MLGKADAALLIGDAALRVDPATLPFETLDLGAEWIALTGLPMVFAVWAGRKEIIREPYGQVFLESLPLRPRHTWTTSSPPKRPRASSSPDVVRRYLTHHIVFELGEKDYEGMRLYIQHALRYRPRPGHG